MASSKTKGKTLKPMTFQEVTKMLEELGTEQNRKIYKRHGAGDNLYGVSFANLGKLRKQIKVDHELAQRLWDTGNIDAQSLATMIADVDQTTEEMLDKWIEKINCYYLVDVFVKNLASKTPFAQQKIEAWTTSEDEWIGRAGWQLLSHLAMDDAESPDDYFEGFLERIEETIHQSKNFTKDSMNSALIAIGIRNEHLEKLATDAARRIGKVEVDHGETACKTPDAVAYIQKTRARQEAKKAKRK